MESINPALSGSQLHPERPRASSKPLSKSQVWPRPSWRSMASRGISKRRLMVLRHLYQALPSRACAKFNAAHHRHADAIRAVRDAALEWIHLESSTTPSSASSLTRSDFQEGIKAIFAKAFGPPQPSDPLYFSRRHIVDQVGCQLYALLGDAPPTRLAPTTSQFDKMVVELARGWPEPPKPWERRSLHLVGKGSISIESRGDSTFARWPLSTARDHGVFQAFGDQNDAREWHLSLAPYLVISDNGSTRLISAHDTEEGAMSTLT